MRLRPGLRVLRRTDTELQVGTDPRWAVRLVDLTPAECRLLLDVDDRTDLTRLPVEARRLGLDADRVAEVVGLLDEARLTVVDRPVPGRPVADRTGHKRADRSRRGPASSEAATWSLLRPVADGDRLVGARSRRSVGVVGLGPTGLGIAVGLASAGVGVVLLDDVRPVRPADVGATGYRWGDVGAVREVVAARVLRDAAPEVRLDGPDGPDLLVLVEDCAADPTRAPVLLASGTAHLSVVLREADALVGPLVDPGRGPCLRCLDLHRADADAAWPLLAAQLVGGASTTAGGGLGGTGREPRGEVATVAGVCAALATAAVVAHLDGTSHHLRGVTYEVALPDVVPRRRVWAVHPECGCTALPAATPSGTGAPATARPSSTPAAPG